MKNLLPFSHFSEQSVRFIYHEALSSGSQKTPESKIDKLYNKYEDEIDEFYEQNSPFTLDIWIDLDKLEKELGKNEDGTYKIPQNKTQLDRLFHQNRVANIHLNPDKLAIFQYAIMQRNEEIKEKQQAQQEVQDHLNECADVVAESNNSNNASNTQPIIGSTYIGMLIQNID